MPAQPASLRERAPGWSGAGDRFVADYLRRRRQVINPRPPKPRNAKEVGSGTEVKVWKLLKFRVPLPMFEPGASLLPIASLERKPLGARRVATNSKESPSSGIKPICERSKLKV